MSTSSPKPPAPPPRPPPKPPHPPPPPPNQGTPAIPTSGIRRPSLAQYVTARPPFRGRRMSTSSPKPPAPATRPASKRPIPPVPPGEALVAELHGQIPRVRTGIGYQI